MISLHCQHRDDQTGHKCGMVFVSIQNGCLMVTSTHDGERHTNVIMLSDLHRLMEEDKTKREPALRP